MNEYPIRSNEKKVDSQEFVPPILIPRKPKTNEMQKRKRMKDMGFVTNELNGPPLNNSQSTNTNMFHAVNGFLNSNLQTLEQKNQEIDFMK